MQTTNWKLVSNKNVHVDMFANQRLASACTFRIFDGLGIGSQRYNRAQIQKVLSEGVQFWQVFLLSWWWNRGSKYHYKFAIIGMAAKLNGVSLEGWWRPNVECWLGSFLVLQRIRTSITKKLDILWFFSVLGGRYGPPVPQSGSTHFSVSSGGPRLELDCCDVQTSLNLHRSICHLVQMLDTSFSLSEHFVPWIKTWVKVLNFQNIELLKIKS